MVAAYLYWSGNGVGNDVDLQVKLNDTPIIAENTRMYFFNGNNANDGGYFSGYADVTQIVKNFGNGEYTLSDFDLTHIFSGYCEGKVNYAGWAIFVVYEKPSLPKNSVTIYDGFMTVDKSSTVSFTLDGFMVTDKENSKIGFLVWEGDSQISGDRLDVNNFRLSNALNPEDNPFNSTNSFTGSSSLWNMDLDYFDLSEIVNVGDTSLRVRLSTDGDIYTVNTIAITLNTILPDATVTINKFEHTCFSRVVNVAYTVSNIGGEHVLKAGVPISFYAGNELISTVNLQNELAIGDSFSDEIELTIPINHDVKFDFKVVVDDDGTSKGLVQEIDEDNNIAQIEADLTEGCSVQKGISPNGDGLNDYLNLELYNVMHLIVYNRYGTPLFEHAGEYKNQWYGQDKNGNKLPTGTYYYVFKTSAGSHAGSIYLMREQ